MYKTKVYIADVDCLNENTLFNRLYLTASKQRREKIDKCADRKNKNLSLGAFVLLKESLKNQDVDGFEIIYAENGKPYLKDNVNIHFNFSHSDKFVMCAISDYEVGCDVEKIRDIDVKIAERCFSDDEYKMFVDLKTTKEKTDLFFRLWTLKESFIKATGAGLKMPLNSFSIKLSDKPEIVQNVNTNKYYLKEFDFCDGYKFSVCSQNSCFDDITTIKLDNLI